MRRYNAPMIAIRLFVPLMIALVLGTLAFEGPGDQDASLTDVRRRGALRVGLDASFPPFEVVTGDGDIVGLDVDLARLLAGRLGVEAQVRNIAFDGLYDALAAGEVDVLISALPYDEMRTRDVAYSAGYFVDGVVIIGPQGPMPPPLAELHGRVAVEMGSEAAMLARQLPPEVEVVQLLSEDEVMRAVAAGDADWGLATKLSACLARSDGGAIAIGPQLTAVPYVVAFRARDVALHRQALSAVDAVLAGDEWQASLDAWLGECP